MECAERESCVLSGTSSEGRGNAANGGFSPVIGPANGSRYAAQFETGHASRSMRTLKVSR